MTQEERWNTYGSWLRVHGRAKTSWFTEGKGNFPKIPFCSLFEDINI